MAPTPRQQEAYYRVVISNGTTKQAATQMGISQRGVNRLLQRLYTSNPELNPDLERPLYKKKHIKYDIAMDNDIKRKF